MHQINSSLCDSESFLFLLGGLIECTMEHHGVLSYLSSEVHITHHEYIASMQVPDFSSFFDVVSYSA